MKTCILGFFVSRHGCFTSYCIMCDTDFISHPSGRWFFDAFMVWYTWDSCDSCKLYFYFKSFFFSFYIMNSMKCKSELFFGIWTKNICYFFFILPVFIKCSCCKNVHELFSIWKLDFEALQCFNGLCISGFSQRWKWLA